MVTFIRLTLAAAMFLSAGYFLGWDDPLRLHLGLFPAFACGVALAIVTWSARPSQEEVEHGLNAVRELAITFLIGLVWTGFTMCWLHVATRHPDILKLLDSDRSPTELALNYYEEHKLWIEAANFTELKWRGVHSPQFTKWLAEKAISYYVLAAIANPPLRDEYLRKAASLADKQGMPRDIYDLPLGLTQEQAVLRTKLEQAGQQLAAAQSDARQREATVADKTKQRLRATRLEVLSLATLLLRQTKRPDFAVIREQAATQIATAQKWKLPTADAERALVDFDSFVAALSPRDFPKAVSVSLRGVVRSETPRLLVADLRVEGPIAATWLPIRSSDLTVTQNGRRLDHVMPVPLHSDRRRLTVAILIDASVSMQGQPREEALRALMDFLRQLPTGIPYWLAQFNDTTTTLVDWSTDPSDGIVASQRIQPAGYTALFDGVGVALKALASRTGNELVLVVLSDGANTKPGPKPEELIAAARGAGVRIYSISLQSGQVDEQALRRLAEGTGGQSIVVSKANQLGREFRKLAEDLSTPRLRVVALDYEPSTSCKITLGSDPAKSIVIPPQIARQTVMSK